MFNRYWRDYPWSFQFIQFISLILVFASVFIMGILPLLVHVTGVPLSDVAVISENSSRKVIHAALLYQFISALGIFLLPALMFGYFSHPQPLQYLGLKKPGKPIQTFLVILVILGAIPVLLGISNWIAATFHLSASLQKMEDDNERQVKGMLHMTTIVDFIFSFLTLAVLPALSEELFFRGVMFRMAAKRNKRIIVPIILTALIFAFFHFNVTGFVSILLAGILLAGIYYLTGSIWLSILAHMIHNGLQIILLFFMKDSAMAKSAMETNVIPWYLPLGGAILFAVSFYLLWQNRTPLPPNWTDDFTPEELLEGTDIMNKGTE